MVLASFYLGFSASIIWVAEVQVHPLDLVRHFVVFDDVIIYQGRYLTSIARSRAHDLNLEKGNVIGNFNGEFWVMFVGHQFVGNLMSLFLLNDGTGGTTSGNGITLLHIVFVCSMTLGTILMCLLQKRDAKGEETLPNSFVSFYSSMVSLSKSVMAPLFDLRMLLIIPFIAYSGLQQAFVWAEYTKYIEEPALGESGVGGAMAVYGVFDAIVNSVYIWNMCQCSLARGRLTSGLKSITMCWSFHSLNCTALASTEVQFLLTVPLCSVTSGVLGILYPLLMAATLGIGDGIFKTQLNALLGMLFKHDMACVSIAVVFFVSPYVSLHAVLVVMLVAVCISVVGFLFLTLMVEKAFSCAD
ncbi:hypothetical protein HYC85_006642 [Camellia sinensis]|uniref:Uncharacterized protein n=1 Tax=Camellia sinensis TaxID=4442 RepID=A0A7J7HP65_CAMSI|nr:hypothetical protein HYC85_006642 [Camellia sinensis]